MLAVQLYIIFTTIAIIYLLLLQYTKFFSFPAYLLKVSLNLNFYFTLLYIIYFSVFLVFLAIDWYTFTLVNVMLFIQHLNVNFTHINFTVENC